LYTQAVHGIDMEAVTFTSTVTDFATTNWIGESRSYQQVYTSPVVVGQVMSYNDPNFSVFWASGASQKLAPDASNLSVGKHVGEDSNTVRADETIGYVVIETGLYSLDGFDLAAGVGPLLVEGMDNTPPFTYSVPLLTSPIAAVVSQAGMNGSNGAWATLYGNTPVTSGSLELVVDEDQIKDSERIHLPEEIAYVVFAPQAGGSLVVGAASEIESQSADSGFASEFSQEEMRLQSLSARDTLFDDDAVFDDFDNTAQLVAMNQAILNRSVTNQTEINRTMENLNRSASRQNILKHLDK